VDRQELKLEPGGGTKSVRLSHHADQPGEYEYVVEVAPREGEANIENNRLVHRVTVRDDSIRVLLVQAYPSYEFRFLKTMLMRQFGGQGSAVSGQVSEDVEAPDAQTARQSGDKTFSVHTVLQEADLEYAANDKTALRSFPVSRDELFQYDVLIFGDVNPALLSPSIMNNIYEFVTARGGGVIFIAGPRYTPLAYRNTPLAALFPMNVENVSLPEASSLAEPFRPRLTPLGEASSVMQIADPGDSVGANERLWREELTPLRWFIDISGLRPGARVLAEHPTRRNAAGEPLQIICLQFVGAGKVIFHATDETHRWRLSVGDVYFARYWMQAIRYLCRAKLLAGRTAELTTSRDDYRLGDAVGLRVRFFDDRQAPAEDDGVAVVVQARSGGLRQRIDLMRAGAAGAARGIFEGSAGLLPAGQYEVWLASPAVEGNIPSHEFSVVAATDELSRTQMDAAAMREAARIAGGKFYTFASVDQLKSDLPPGRQVRVESLPPVPIWNTPAVAGLFVLLIALEWLLRRRVGML
jgi:hypothetical protein